MDCTLYGLIVLNLPAVLLISCFLVYTIFEGVAKVIRALRVKDCSHNNSGDSNVKEKEV
jgi:hypothetical protein